MCPRATWRVIPGVPESLDKVPGHRAVNGIDRFLLLDRKSLPAMLRHCAAHIVSERLPSDSAWQYTHPEAHSFDEINILLSERGELRFRYEADGRTEIVASPCTVYIPAGTMHRMEAVGGTGIFLCIHLHEEGTQRPGPLFAASGSE